jgi:beta-glucosidase
VGALATIANIPVEAGQVSLGNTSYYLDAGKDPLFPFGYGLSYTTFEYDDLKLSAAKLRKDDSLHVSCQVRNTGNREGVEIVQLYVQDRTGSVTRPVKELKAFERIALQPGESRTISFTLRGNDLKFWNHENREVLEAGAFRLWIGPNSAEGPEDTFELEI